MSTRRAALALLAVLVPCGAPHAGAGSAPTFESGQTHPLALSPDRARLFAVDTPDGALEVFDVTGAGLVHAASVPVGMEPVAVAARTNTEVWVVNHLSDSVSVVDLSSSPPRVVRTLLVGDEPRDIVFAGTDRRRAFVTTAHRGQNSPIDPELTSSSVGRADVWVFDALALGSSLGGDPLTIVTLFGDTPRALAATPDGGTVYAAVFHSGNQTTTLAERSVCNDYVTFTCEVDGRTMPGGLPAPFWNFEGAIRPEVGMIVKFDPPTGEWRDPLGRDWRDAIRFSLPDEDVFAIDANATPPVEREAYSGVGTIIYGLAVNPVTGMVYASNTEARNEVRFSGPGITSGSTVRGHLHESRITVLDAGGVRPRHLNKHIDYGVVPSPPGVKERSLALPIGLAVTADGTTLYVAALGSSAIGVLDTAALENDTFVPDAANHIGLSGGGPTGLVLDEARDRLYVLTRFDNAVSVVKLSTREEEAHVALFDPEPAAVAAGRVFLYDARLGSTNGEATCAGCHVFGDFDSLAWDLGNPDAPMVPDPNPTRTQGAGPPPPAPDFHPMKGPMTTQSLRGIATHGPMHWRGDRSGALVGGDALDERAAFLQFNEAFVNLQGNDTPLSVTEMEQFADFALAITPPPNPIRHLDSSLTPEQETARVVLAGVGECLSCHRDDPAHAAFGTDGFTAPNEGALPQFMKIPRFDNLYQKIGMFERRPPANSGDTTPVGPQVRGFGFLHNGSQGFPPSGETELPYLLAFNGPLAPIVGQQITLTGSNGIVAGARIDLLEERASLGECDLVVKGRADGEARGWLATAGGTFLTDRSADLPLADATLRALAAVPGQELTYTCVPPASGIRAGLDRDEDGTFDGDERDLGTDPADPASGPVTCVGGLPVNDLRLRIAARQDPTGDETISVKGKLMLPASVDPLAGGVHLSIRDTNGAYLFARNVPGTAAGWRVVVPGARWVFRDPSGTSAGGITHITIRRRTGELFRFKLRGKGLGIRLGTPAPGSVAVALGSAAQCAGTTLAPPGPSCRVRRRATVCR